jgi:uncharacterized OsmC-like protein
MSHTVSVTVTQQDKYRFLVDFGAGIAPVPGDEPAPLGEGAGPSPSQLLLAAVSNCLSSSLFFALQKFRQEAGGITATASARIDRNEENRLRLQAIDVTIRLGRSAAEFTHLERVLSQFEPFCTVTQSVRRGIPVNVTVEDGLGKRLK